MDGASIVFIGDVHGRLDLLSRAVAVAPDGALLAFVGDFIDMRHPALVNRPSVEAWEALDVHAGLIDALNAIDRPCFYVLGNHDPLLLAADLGTQWTCVDLDLVPLPGTGATIGGIGGSHVVPPQLRPGDLRRFLEATVPGSPSNVASREGFEKYAVELDGKPHTVLSKVPAELSCYNARAPDIFLAHTPPVLPIERPPSRAVLQFKSLGLASSIERIRPSCLVSGHVHVPRPQFYAWIHDGNGQTACIQTGTLNPRRPLWMVSFGAHERVPTMHPLKW